MITSSFDASPDTWLLPAARVLKDKFIVATFLRTSLLKISVELCFILPWINWISESSLRVHHAAWTGFCWLIFVADPKLKCLIVSWLYAVRRLSGGGCSYLDSINQDLASWLLSIQIPDQSNGQIIIAKKYKMNFPSDIISHQHYIQIYPKNLYRIRRQLNRIWQLFFI